MQPEISRRCLACGASVRAQARFCPQCGQGVDGESPRRRDAAPPQDKKAGAQVKDAGGTTRRAKVSSAAAGEKASESAPEKTTGEHKRKAKTTGETESPFAAAAGDAGQGRAAGKRHRANVLVEENLRPRVEKLREASMVVLEDASEDSGVRFVLIALVFFLLFLIFLLVSNLLK